MVLHSICLLRKYSKEWMWIIEGKEKEIEGRLRKRERERVDERMIKKGKKMEWSVGEIGSGRMLKMRE